MQPFSTLNSSFLFKLKDFNSLGTFSSGQPFKQTSYTFIKRSSFLYFSLNLTFIHIQIFNDREQHVNILWYIALKVTVSKGNGLKPSALFFVPGLYFNWWSWTASVVAHLWTLGEAMVWICVLQKKPNKGLWSVINGKISAKKKLVKFLRPKNDA